MKFIEYNVWDINFDLRIWIDDKWWSQVSEIAQNIWAITWINWVFECPKDYTECGWKNFTINERYVQWETDKINPEREWDIWEWFANFPVLLENGESQIETYIDLGLVDNKMTWKGRRSFICSTQAWDKIYFGHVYNIWVDWMSLLLKDFGCYNALNLDAGYSTAFLYNGTYIAGPGRDILDEVFVVPKNFQITDLEIKIQHIISSLETYFTHKSPSQQQSILSALEDWLNSLTHKIYNQHTIPYFIHEENVGTKIEINDTSTLKKIYIINRLRDEIKNF